MTSAIILDTETTDSDPDTCEVMELAWKMYDGPGVFQRRYRPDHAPKWGALAVHHIMWSDTEGLDPSGVALSDVHPVTYWIGHNIDFDWKALRKPHGQKRICTLALCRSLWPECDSHSLSAMAYFLLGANEETRQLVKRAHSALDDVLLCEKILGVIMTVAKIDSLDELYLESEDARIPRVMTFGKHKGKRIEEVDRGYVKWYRGQDDTDPYLLEAFRRAGK